MTKIKPCSTCPFRKDTTNYGRLDYLQDLFFGVFIKGAINHTCHKTDPNADGYINHSVRKKSVCWGFVSVCLKSGATIENEDATSEMAESEINHNMIDGSETFDSIVEFFKHHLSLYGFENNEAKNHKHNGAD